MDKNKFKEFPFNMFQFFYDTLPDEELEKFVIAYEHNVSDVRATFFYHFNLLPLRTTEVLIKHYRDGKSYKELAAEYEVGVSRVCQLAYHARSIFRRTVSLNDLLIGIQAVQEKEKEQITKESFEKGKAFALSQSETERIYGEDVENNPFIDKSLSSLGLSTRAFNSLYRAKIYTVRDVINMNEIELLKVKNLGYRTFVEIVNTLKSCGLSLKKAE